MRTCCGQHNPFARPLVSFVFAVLMTGSTAGCTSNNFAALRPGLETRGGYIEGVPFYRQSEAACGPAALASVLAFYGRPESLERITAGIYLPELRGTLPMDMERFARDAGFKTTSGSGTLTELKASIRKGMPVICMLDLGFGLYRQPHYISVIGYDDVNAVVIGHDGLKANSVIGYEKFNAKWKRAGCWLLAIEPRTPRGAS